MAFAHQDATNENDNQIVAQGTSPWVVSFEPSGNESTRKTFVAQALGATLGNNKSMLSLLNAGGSGVVLRLERLFIINTQNSSVTGINADFRIFRTTGHSVGTSITPLAHDTGDTLNGSVTARTGATVAGEAASYLYRWLWGSDEWSTGVADADSADHSLQNLQPVYQATSRERPITLRAGEGLSVKQVVNSTAGQFDIIAIFTEAAT
jgi:hypothetical protein